MVGGRVCRVETASSGGRPPVRGGVEMTRAVMQKQAVRVTG